MVRPVKARLLCLWNMTVCYSSGCAKSVLQSNNNYSLWKITYTHLSQKISFLLHHRSLNLIYSNLLPWRYNILKFIYSNLSFYCSCIIFIIYKLLIFISIFISIININMKFNLYNLLLNLFFLINNLLFFYIHFIHLFKNNLFYFQKHIRLTNSFLIIVHIVLQYHCAFVSLTDVFVFNT